jgi:hypothetical protein
MNVPTGDRLASLARISMAELQKSGATAEPVNGNDNNGNGNGNTSEGGKNGDSEQKGAAAFQEPLPL